MRPGAVLGDGASPAFGPLSAIDHANLDVGTVVKMHEHKNDEILSYLWRGTMVHEDTTGDRTAISANKLMMMNAGESFWHEERTPDAPVEMLQIFVRPREADLPASVAFYERPDGTPIGEWGQVAGPEGVDAPLTIRNTVRVYDARLHEGQTIEAVKIEGLSPWLYVMDGVVKVGAERLGKGDAVSDLDQSLPTIRALSDATLVLFLVDRTAPASTAGTISGH
jgi:redox-sensitive bicupin YhaK (pirin superfamily)